MKKTILSAFLAIAAGCINAQTVKVNITGIRNETGNILIMMQSATQEQPLKNMKNATRDTCSFVFKNIENHRYKISVFHDENDNYQIDKDEKGIPTEGFAIKTIDIDTIMKQNKTTEATLKLFYPTLSK
jgi:uncharacterized protein (DUF2141 family)